MGATGESTDERSPVAQPGRTAETPRGQVDAVASHRPGAEGPASSARPIFWSRAWNRGSA